MSTVIQHPDAKSTLREFSESAYIPIVRPRTRERVRGELKRWERLTGNPPIAEISKNTIREFRDRLIGEQYAPDTIVINVGTILTILRVACREHDLIESVPEIGRLRINRRRPNPKGATVEQVDAVFTAADLTSWPRLHVPPVTLWRAWIALSAWTGLRVSDSLLHLQGKHVLPEERCIVYQAEKTAKRHVFPMPDWLWKLIRPLHRGPDERLFPIELNAAYDERVVRIPKLFGHELRKLCKRAGVDPITSKQLRQFAVTQWTIADGRAGELIHGCGLPRVLKHYLAVLSVLESASPNVVMPDSFTAGSVAAPTGPNREEWEFREGEFRCRGRWYRLASTPKRNILKHLVEADGPVSWRLLCGHLNSWPDPDDDNTSRHTYKRVVVSICELRKLLCDALCLPNGFDPIPCTKRGFGAAWTVYLPPTIGRG